MHFFTIDDKKHGGQFYIESTRVLSDNILVLVINDSYYYCVQVIHTETVYWKVDSPELFSVENFPVIIFENERGNFIYGQPIHEHPGLMKVSYT